MLLDFDDAWIGTLGICIYLLRADFQLKTLYHTDWLYLANCGGCSCRGDNIIIMSVAGLPYRKNQGMKGLADTILLDIEPKRSICRSTFDWNTLIYRTETMFGISRTITINRKATMIPIKRPSVSRRGRRHSNKQQNTASNKAIVYMTQQHTGTSYTESTSPRCHTNSRNVECTKRDSGGRV